MNTDILKMTFSTASNSDVVTVTSDGDLIQYKSDDYVNKVFKYFVFELIKDDNDETKVLSESDIFKLINNKLEINESNIDTQPECIRNLYEDVMKLKNNYLFAYYLSRLYENRLQDNHLNSAQKYYDFSEYIIGLNVDFETLDWSTLKIVKKKQQNLYNIYGEKMHRVTNEFLNKGYIKEITEIENIDDILKLYKMDTQTKLYDIKLSKLIDLQNEFNNLDLLKISDDDNDSNDDSNDDSYKCCEEGFCEEGLCEDTNEYDEINEWYYGVNDNKKEEFEELVLNIIQKYEKSKRIKLIDEEIERKQKWDKYVNNIIYNVLKFSIIYCFVSYIFMFYNILNDINTNKNTTNNLDIIIDNLSNIDIIENTCNKREKLIHRFHNYKPFEFQF